jgi:NAD(P)-dependent dehydrogenase (short-subunit alcohol dehydrogenase family)
MNAPPPSTIDLTGQVTVVTGASRGIGGQIAKTLARAGAKVVIVGRHRDTLARMADRIRSEGGEALPIEADVARQQQVERLRRTLEANAGRIDLLVNNAGILGVPGRWWVRPAQEWWRVLEVNLKGAMLCTQAFLPGMLAGGRGRIINMGSNAGVNPKPGLGPYAVSKAALIQLTDSLAADLENTGVGVFAVSPGLVKTDLSRRLPAVERIPKDQWLPARRVADLCLTIAGGRADGLSGRYLHAGLEVASLLAKTDTIVARDLYKLRLREDADL